MNNPPIGGFSLAVRDGDVHFLSAVLTALFVKRTGEAEMEILARRLEGASCAGTGASINPGSIAFMAEEI
ncbi:MAG: hypothetical protein IT406_02700 [Candidatus Yanofskybacteria bacterium]|nr:hypothetical protein [Candidatus Yanofskybacteria bacterium]